MPSITPTITPFTREKHRSYILSLIAESKILPEIFDAVTRGVESFYSNTLCSISLLDTDNEHLRIVSAPSLPTFYTEAMTSIKIGPTAGSCGTAAYLGQRIVVENIQTDPLWRNYKTLAEKAGLASCWSEPIMNNAGEVLGTFAMYHRTTHTPSLMELESIHINALLIGIAIERDVATKNQHKTKRNYQSIKEQQKFLLSSTETVSYVCSADPDFTTYWVSENFTTQTGYRREDLVGCADFWLTYLHPEDHVRLQNEFNIMIENKSAPHTQEYRIKYKDKTEWRWLHDIWYIRYNEDEQRDEVVGFWFDVTEEKQLKQKSLTLQDEQTFILKSMSGFSYICDVGPNFETQWVSDNFTEVTGYDVTQPMVNWVSLIHPDDVQRVTEETNRLVNDRHSVHTQEFRIFYKKYNNWRIIEDTWQVRHNEEKNKLEIYGHNVDVTEERLTKKAYHNLHEEQQLILSHVSVVTYRSLADDNFTLLWVSDNYTDITGYQIYEVLGNPHQFEKTTPLEDRLRIQEETFFKPIEKNKLYTHQVFRYKHKDGHFLWVNEQWKMVFNEAEQRDEIIGCWFDISEQKKIELKLERANALLSATQKNANIGGWEIDLLNDTLLFTEETYRIHDLNPDEYTPNVESAINFYAPASIPIITEAVNQAITNGIPYELELELITAKNRHIWVHTVGSAITDQAGNVIKVIGSFQDITERKLIEDTLKQTNQDLDFRIKTEINKNLEKDQLLQEQSRIASMGEMVGNIAHQWRQPLNSLSLVLADLEDAFNYKTIDKNYLATSINKSTKIIQSMSDTIDDFRDFFKAGNTTNKFLLKENIESCLHLIEASLIYNNITVHLDGLENIMVIGNGREFSQAVLNILSNAKDAILHSKTNHKIIEIRIKNNDDYGIVSISDTGGGIPEEVRARIFEPYFTTKSQGVGIGLYMAHTIISHKMNGLIRVKHKTDGAQFTLYIPLHKSGMTNE